ncbi:MULTISPECIES: acyl-CoA dehydrogenase family protein [Nocardioides]|uniref:Acyl-CoA dehydrogenase family protein n=1 Tax=Nocardioides vastitatis TaxID=2568655 RepID=A0ABW0ZS76_9ACTN|nr:acyl-CoA dehydrogenase family protein [Nocardioides sp.]THI98661.1 acyl-CoA dehydrogenase [Nocardioides sp.]
MRFALSAEQAELAATVRSLLEKRADSAAVRAASTSPTGHDEALWVTLCEQIGVAALAIPEEYDGVGAGFFETAVVLEEIGRSLAPSPLLATTIATEALLAGGSDEARQRLLPRIAAGEIVTLVLGDASVLDGDRAAIVLAVVGDDLVELAEPRARWAESMDQSIRLAFVDVAGAEAAVIGHGGAARARAELVGAAAVSALAVGLCDRALRMTVDYSKERVQFGRPIGSFQALKHRMADMLCRTELARSASWAASYALSDPDTAPAEAELLTRSAASYSLEAAQHVAAECVQLHGGIAITWEHDAHLVFKRAHALGQLFGAPHRHRRSVTL